MRKGQRVQNAVSGQWGTCSGEASERLSNCGQSVKWAYGVRKDSGQYTAWAVQNCLFNEA